MQSPQPLETVVRRESVALAEAISGAVHLRRDGVSVVFEAGPRALPTILYWGAALADLSVDDLSVLMERARSPRSADTVDAGVRLSVLPQASDGWIGRPGVTGHRGGRTSLTEFSTVEIGQSEHSIRVIAGSTSGLQLELDLELAEGGLLRQRATIRNLAADPYTLDDVTLVAPVPARAVEVLDLAGGHMRERRPQRATWDIGTRMHESRRGRPGLQSSTFVAVGERGFSFAAGDVWAVHVAWSGNHRMFAEHNSSADRVIGGGELLLPGEAILGEGESYVSPWVVFAWGRGVDELSRRFHDWIRRRPGRATRPRPVTVNTWEAVYFGHGLQRLTELAQAAGRAGVERFVLDDGWFGGRRDDLRGLGDWVVSDEVWPDGLAPLIDSVHAAGMEFGLWVEPEMINEDSDLFRQHPDWALGVPGRVALSQRHQQVLDLANPQAYAHIRDRLMALLDEHEIAYLKWDHNRDLVEAVEAIDGAPRARQQTIAFYRLLDELKAAHPDLEIESCASGGGRVDLGVLERVDRIWGSDSLDPIERQRIQRWTGVLVPPELVGSHIGGTPAFDTGRITPLDFRAITALFGHFGIELDLTRLDESVRDRIAEWVAYSKSIRGLISIGTTVRIDDPDPSRLIHGVVTPDRAHGIFAVAALDTSIYRPSPLVTIRGLDPDRRYRVRLAPPLHSRYADDPLVGGIELSGELLHTSGLRVPALRQAEAVLLEIEAVAAGGRNS